VDALLGGMLCCASAMASLAPKRYDIDRFRQKPPQFHRPSQQLEHPSPKQMLYQVAPEPTRRCPGSHQKSTKLVVLEFMWGVTARASSRKPGDWIEPRHGMESGPPFAQTLLPYFHESLERCGLGYFHSLDIVKTRAQGTIPSTQRWRNKAVSPSRSSTNFP